MNPKVRTFPELIRWLADKHHDGHVLPVAQKTGISPALVNLWVKGQVKNPTVTNLQRLCAAYGLDFLFVVGLVQGRRAALPISGGSGEPPGLSVVQLLDNNVPYQTCVRWLRAWWARPLHGLPCPA